MSKILRNVNIYIINHKFIFSDRTDYYRRVYLIYCSMTESEEESTQELAHIC